MIEMIDMIELWLIYMIELWLIYDWFMMINMMDDKHDDEHDDVPSFKL
jgi:hypothetical protein